LRLAFLNIFYFIYFFDHKRIIGRLVKVTKSIHVKNDAGATPLEVAVREGRFRMAEPLIKRGAKVDEAILRRGIEGGHSFDLTILLDHAKKGLLFFINFILYRYLPLFF
jgi:hypothetical protein